MKHVGDSVFEAHVPRAVEWQCSMPKKPRDLGGVTSRDGRHVGREVGLGGCFEPGDIGIALGRSRHHRRVYCSTGPFVAAGRGTSCTCPDPAQLPAACLAMP
mmetsp:Transcript_44437/g.88822  ORF Transcript_44437/g.88822 Transcript_44437/m.88822 type:complete len:102 (-) Transcript_44437:554-859(-)